MFKVHLCHLKHISTISQEHISSLAVLSHILVFTFLECFKFFRIITFYPASLVKTYRLPTALGIVFIFQTVLDYFKLQLTYGTDNLATVELVDKELCHTFVHKLVDTLVELFCLHRVGILDTQ